MIVRRDKYGGIDGLLLILITPFVGVDDVTWANDGMLRGKLWLPGYEQPRVRQGVGLEERVRTSPPPTAGRTDIGVQVALEYTKLWRSNGRININFYFDHIFYLILILFTSFLPCTFSLGFFSFLFLFAFHMIDFCFISMDYAV